ncbi:hypothetical protein FA482_05340 [Pseudomonas aeruginosa]|nr:hypothetical protein [Pseudomonas aeruginosa]MCO3665801.1 hypothetical protein [Pseudomonas aeruginosa]MDV6412967.1 hypothetical protein [Pseudomonas aeruginosa]RTC64046.1 hypothetical protein EJ892_08210 [Pseudomonas aeruginosa]
MLPTPTLAERVILPAAWGGSYFFNRIGRFRSVTKVRFESIAAGRDYGVTGKAACKRWSARMQMLGQEECNRVVKPVQLRINHGAPAGGCSPVAFSCSPARTQPFLPSGKPFRVGLLPL